MIDNTQVESKLDAAFEVYEQGVRRYALQVYSRVVVPFLDKRGWSFDAGMGTWVFSDETGESVYADDPDFADDEEFQRVAAILGLPIPGLEQEFGSYME